MLFWAFVQRVMTLYFTIFSSRFPEPEEEISQTPLYEQTLFPPPLKGTLPLRRGRLALVFCGLQGELRDTHNKTRLRNPQVALKRVCVISGRAVRSRRTGGQNRRGVHSHKSHLMMKGEGLSVFVSTLNSFIFVCAGLKHRGDREMKQRRCVWPPETPQARGPWTEQRWKEKLHDAIQRLSRIRSCRESHLSSTSLHA